MLEQLGIPVYFSDDEEKRIMVTYENLIQGIKDSLGQEAYDKKSMKADYLERVVLND